MTQSMRKVALAGAAAAVLLLASVTQPQRAQGKQDAPPPSSAKSGHLDFGAADKNSDGKINQGEAAASGLVHLLNEWRTADTDGNDDLSRQEYASYFQSRGGSDGALPGFASVDADGDSNVDRAEASTADLKALIARWHQFDKDGDSVLSRSEFAAFEQAKARPKKLAKKPEMTIGRGKFASPETVLWDEQADVYLVSNVNGALTALDENGFISRVAPDGTIMDLKWIDPSQPGVTLHGPKGMVFQEGHLAVADVNAVRFFDRVTGKPVNSVALPDAYMPNDLAVGPDGTTIYVSDSGDETGDHPGAVYRIEGSTAALIAQGTDLDRPDGLVWHEEGLLVTPFGAHAKNVYRLTPAGKRRDFARIPTAQLDGLLKLHDGSFAITSWKGDSVYHLKNATAKPETVVAGIPTPAQIEYDSKRSRLLVPVLEENEVRIYPWELGTNDQAQE